MKVNIKKTKIMASGPITSWQIGGGKVEAADFILLGSKISLEGDCSQEIKRHLLFGRKAMTYLEKERNKSDARDRIWIPKLSQGWE